MYIVCVIYVLFARNLCFACKVEIIIKEGSGPSELWYPRTMLVSEALVKVSWRTHLLRRILLK